MRIAVIEDDDDLLEVTTVMLQRAGHDVIFARDGAAGVDLVRAEQPDLVLLDLMLPERDGFGVLKDLDEEGVTDRIPVILVSALVGREDRRRGLELGAAASITKPFGGDELLALVRRVAALPPAGIAEHRQAALAELAIVGFDVHEPTAVDGAGLAGVLDLSVDAIVSVDEDQRIIGFNRGAAMMFDYTLQEALGQPLDLLLPPDVTRAHAEHIRSFSRTPETSRHMGERREIHGRRRDGSLFPAEASILKQVVDGRPTFTAVLRDVSERRQLIDELRARARQQAAVAQLGQRALVAESHDDFLREVAHAVATTLEVEMVLVAEAGGGDRLTVRASVGLDQHPTAIPDGAHLAEVVAAGAAVVIDGSAQGGSSATRLLGDRPAASGIGVPIADARRVSGAVGAYSTRHRSFTEDDIHFLQAVANVVAGFVERRRVETRLRRFLDAAPDATLVVAGDGRIVSANPQAEELLGYPRERLVGSVVEDLVPELSRSLHVAHREDYGREPRVRTMGAGRELTVLHADGREIAVDIMLSPMETDEGLLVVAALRDVSDRRRNEAMREAFLRAVSHDLRTPLAALIGYASLVSEDDSIEGDNRLYVDRIVANGEKLSRLLGDLLDLDRLSRGVLEPNRRPTDLADLARRVADSIDLSGRDVEVVARGDGVTADVDPAQVERIVENLLANVARHTPAGTACRVIVSDDDGPVLVVEDEGPGVPDEVKATIFDPFQRGAARDHSPGTGIGLSLVSRFAELHGGGAHVEDRPGGGARFVVRLGGA